MPRKRKPDVPHGYGNRSDLQQKASSQPVLTPTGGAYGAASQLASAQKAAPVPQAGPTNMPTLNGGVGGGTGTAVTPSTPGPAGDPIGAAQAMEMPAITPMGAPTQRPGEPVTTGMNGGPGAGPIAPPNPLIHAAASLNSIPPDQMDPDMRRMMQVINAHLANTAAP